MSTKVLDAITAILIGVLFMIGAIFIVRSAQLEAKLQAIEAVCYSNAYENPAMWPILDIVDGVLGEE